MHATLADKFCCDPGWATGIFVAQKNLLEKDKWEKSPYPGDGGPIPCSKFTLDSDKTGSGTCVEGMKRDQVIWTGGSMPNCTHPWRPTVGWPQRVFF